MALWTMQQDDAFFEEREDESLSHIIFGELQLTDQQKDKIRSHRERIRQLALELRQMLQGVRSFREEANRKNESLSAIMDEIQQHMTATQAAKFILWVSNNQACMAMLSKLWDAEDVESGSSGGASGGGGGASSGGGAGASSSETGSSVSLAASSSSSSSSRAGQ